jgi:hypothetical protein
LEVFENAPAVLRAAVSTRPEWSRVF